MKERIAKIEYEDYNEKGLIRKGVRVEGEDSGTLIIIEKEAKKNDKRNFKTSDTNWKERF